LIGNVFEQSFAFGGDGRRALAAARERLCAAGLRVDLKGEEGIEASNPEFWGRRGSALSAFSVLNVRIAEGALVIRGELGALERRRKLMQLGIILLVGAELVGYELLLRGGHPILGFSAGMVLSVTALCYVIIYLQSQMVAQPRAIAAARGLAREAVAAGS
jgi:hypothetical protein